VRSKSNEKMLKNKTKRKALVNEYLEWKIEHKKTGMFADEYREFSFKIRYYFIGKKNYSRIKEILKSEKNLSFKKDIEPLYNIATKVNLILDQVSIRI